jgi:hypothetical protein
LNEAVKRGTNVISVILMRVMVDMMIVVDLVRLLRLDEVEVEVADLMQAGWGLV